MLSPLAAASTVFAVLYFALFVGLLAGYATGRLKFMSRWTLILLHVTIRLGAQATGIGFGVLGFKNWQFLVAYLILGAEGYFSLVLCTARFLVNVHKSQFISGDSWLEPNRRPGETGVRGFVMNFSVASWKRRPMSAIHWLLVVANAIIISGASMLSGTAGYTDEQWRTSSAVSTARAMRTAGQSIFLAVNVGLLYCFLRTFVQLRREDASQRSKTGAPARPWYGDATLAILLASWPLLIVRGIFGILQAVLPDLNWYNPNIYDDAGLTPHFVLLESILATTMEWATCALLCTSYPLNSMHARRNPHLGPSASVDSDADHKLTGGGGGGGGGAGGVTPSDADGEKYAVSPNRGNALA